MLKSSCRLPWLIGLVAWLGAPALGNTEKAVFLGPRTVNMPATHPNLGDLRLDTLTPEAWTLRAQLDARPPTEPEKSGKETWLVLDELSEGRRYEVRVCWAATQPTDFKMNIYELPTVFETPELIAGLSEYSFSRQPTDRGDEKDSPEIRSASSTKPSAESEASILLLQILAAADYYTTNKTLMVEVPPVFVDIILDPYVLNVLPRSLLPTVGYIAVVSAMSYLVARRMSAWMCQVARQPGQSKKQR